MLYVYAIVDRPELPLPNGLGLNDETLSSIVWRDIGTVVSVYDRSLVPTAAEELWRHEQVVEALMGQRAVLPARFGTLFASAHGLQAILRRAYPALIENLRRVRDHVEIGITFLLTAHSGSVAEAPIPGGSAAGLRHVDRNGESTLPLELEHLKPPATGPGTAYLWAKLERERAERNGRQVQLEVIRKVCEGLAEHASASRLDEGQADRPVVSAAFLVESGRLMPFREAVARAANAHPELALLCTGAWPPYSFVTAQAGETSMGGGS